MMSDYLTALAPALDLVLLNWTNIRLKVTLYIVVNLKRRDFLNVTRPVKI